MTTPDRFRFRVSPDGRQFAIWEPGNEPWFVPESNMQGRWVTTTDMDRLGWTLFVPVPAGRDALRQRIAAALYERERPPRDPHWPDVYASDREVFEGMADAVLAVLPELTGQTTGRAPAEPFPIWTVWREEQPAYGYFATEDIAKQATIDCWEEDEPPCPDYSWRPDGAPGGWELLVGGERAEVYVRRHLVYGGLPQPPRAAVLRWAADVFERDHMVARMFGHQVAAELRRLADEAQPTEGKRPLTLATPCAVCKHPYNWHTAGICQADGCECIAFAVDGQTTDEAQPTTETPAETQPESCAHCGKNIRRITGTLTEWWVHAQGGQALCSPWQPARSARATPKPAAEVQQDDTWPVKEATRRYAAELRSNPGTVVADGHTECSCGVLRTGPGRHLPECPNRTAAGARQDGAQQS